MCRPRPSSAGDLGERGRVHDALADPRQFALGHRGEPPERHVRGDPAEHCVTEELQPFIARMTWVLGTPGAVRHRRAEDGLVGQAIPQSSDEVAQ